MNEWPICDRCKKEITSLAFIVVQPSIVLQKHMAPVPPIFSCPEQAENYSKTMRFHDDCWIAELKDHGVAINNMKDVILKYQEAAKQGDK